MKKTLLLLLASAMMLSGCGETGPQGPKGDPGEQGLPGLNGKDGVDGQNGKDGKDGVDGQNGKDGKDGADGQNGSNGKDGKDGIGIISISKASTVKNVDTYVILYSDNHTESFTVTNGLNGKDGETGSQGIQGVPGADGHTPVVTISDDGYWVIDDVKTSTLAQGPKGADGVSITSIDKTSTSGLVDTYTITYSNGATSTFTVTNGLNGKDGETGSQGIQGVPGADGHTPVVTMSDDGYWVIDDVKTSTLAQGPKGNDGVSVVSILKTSSIDLVDTYTITYSNGNTSSFTVTNGAQGTQGIQGEKGADGVTPTISINQSNHWVINGTDTGINATGLQGPKGDTGKDGSSLLTGNGIPSDMLGSNNDSYIDLSTWNYYVKSEGSWTLKGNIKGESVEREKAEYTVTFNTNGGSEIEPQVVKDGGKITPPENPTKEGYIFLNWTLPSGFVISDTEGLSFWDFYCVTSDVEIAANWKSGIFNLNVSSNLESAGTFSCNDKTGVASLNESVLTGSSVSVTAVANTGYKFINWTVDGVEVSTDSTYTFSMNPNNVNLVANFERLKYHVTISNVYEFCSASDAGKASGEGDYYPGTSVTVKVTSDPLVTFVGWYNGSTKISSDKSYTFTMPNSNYTITAKWSLL